MEFFCYHRRPGPAADLEPTTGTDDLIAHGPLLSDDGSSWLGTAALVQAADPVVASAVLTPDRYADFEVHEWHFGGRPT